MIYNFCAQARSVALAAVMIVVITATTSPVKVRADHLSSPEQGSDFRVVALEGDAAPADLGGAYSKIVASSINNSGDVVFSANLAGASVDSAIIRISEDETRALLRSGEPSPGGGRYKTFGDLDFARLTFMEKEATYLLFRAEIEGGSAKEGIFLWTPDEVRAIALAGGKSPRGRTYESFTQLTINAITAIGGPGYSLAFVANVENGKKTLVFEHTYSSQNGELNTGDLEGTFKTGVKDVIDDFVISRMSINIVCVLQVHRENNSSKSYRRAVLFNGGRGIIEYWSNLQEGAPYTVVGKLKRMLEPPAIYVQTPLITAEFKKKKRRGILSTGFFVPGLFVLTGDPAPGLPDETIQDIGPAICNAGYPGGLAPRTVVSTVVLSSGRMALLILSNKAMLMLIGGNTSNERVPVLRTFSSVKLNDQGTLLLRGSVGEGSATREGLFLLHRLFER